LCSTKLKSHAMIHLQVIGTASAISTQSWVRSLVSFGA
jgi:hypothetical protein